MNKPEMKNHILSKIQNMIDSWNGGDVIQAQKDYEYLSGFCESSGHDFNKTLQDGLARLLLNCVGIQDTIKITRYMNSEISPN